MEIENIFQNISIDKSKEEFIDILKSDNIRIERIVSNGQSSKKDFWYCQEENEFVLLLEGNAILEFESEEISLSKGEYININAFTKHRIKYTSETVSTVWLAVFYK